MYQLSVRRVVTALSLACLSAVFANEAHAAARRPTAAVVTMQANGTPWCLQCDSVTARSFRERDPCDSEHVYTRPVCRDPGD